MMNCRAFWGGAIVACVQATTAQSAPEWTGYWAFDPAWCINAAETGSREDAPVYLADTEMIGLENSCDVVNHGPAGIEGAYWLDLACSAEGDHFDERIMLLMGAKDAMWLYRTGRFMTKFQRCR